MHIFLEFLSKFVTLDDFSAREPTNVYIQSILHLKVIKYGKNLGENKEKDKRLNVGIPTLKKPRSEFENQGQNGKRSSTNLRRIGLKIQRFCIL